MDTIKTVLDWIVKNAGEFGIALTVIGAVLYKVIKRARKADIYIETGAMHIKSLNRSVTGKLDFEKDERGHFRFMISVEDSDIDPIEIVIDNDHSVPVSKETGKPVVIVTRKQLERMKVGSPLQLKQVEGDPRHFRITKISKKK